MTSIPDESKYIVETKNGPICGYVEERNEGFYYKFKSIPYAKPPVGNLRFMPPSLISPWTEVKDCTQDAPMPFCFCCGHVVGSEDCLYLEVSTPNLNPEKPLPIMFWIGSYGYAYLCDNILDCTQINKENVIFVRCGFRLGPFGFLTINDITAPGNNGLKDITIALKWVQTNISKFGGDPQNVTIFGNSSGGAIVHLLMLSPMASGLFHKAIMQSASALNNWSLAKNPYQAVTELAKALGITHTCKMEIIQELRSIPASKLMEAFTHLEDKKKCNLNESDHQIFDALFKPCIEEEFEGQPAFLTKSPPLIIKSGNFNKVPLIIGSNNIEGSVLQFIKSDFYDDFQKYNENVGLIVPKALVGDLKLAKHIGQQLLRFYLGGEERLTKDTRNQYLQLISDYYFLYYVHKTVQLHSQFGLECPIYYYVMNYAGEWQVPEELQFFNSLGHCAEIPFLFPIKLPDLPVCKGSRDSVKTRQRVVRMWTNFAKYGHPTPDPEDPLLQINWDPVENKEKLNYLSIGSELTKGRNPFRERMAFWEELHKEHTFLRVLVYFNDLGVTW